MQMHELDLANMFTGVYDIFPNIGQASKGKEYAFMLKNRLAKRGIGFPFGENAKYIALGAGNAAAELAFAQELGIAPTNIYLLDKAFTSEAVHTFETDYPDSQVLHSGIFTFLSKPQETKFTYISAFNIDHLLDDNIGTFIPLLPPLLTNNATVAINFYQGDDVHHVWQSHGFVPLHQPEEHIQFFLYEGNYSL